MRLTHSLLIITTFFLGSCKKDTLIPLSTSSITVVNAAQEVPSVEINFADTMSPFYLYQTPISYAAAKNFGILSGTTPFVMVSSADTSRLLVQSNVNLAPGGIYSLYLLQGGPKPEYLLMQDSVPVFSDTTAGVRFVNLSPDSKSFSINLATNDASITEFNNISYKQATSFKSYKALAFRGAYSFEIRDQASGDLLITCRWVYRRSNSSSLVICGSIDPNSSTPLSVFQINNF